MYRYKDRRVYGSTVRYIHLYICFVFSVTPHIHKHTNTFIFYGNASGYRDSSSDRHRFHAANSFGPRTNALFFRCCLWSPGVPLTFVRAFCCYYIFVYMCPSYADHSSDYYSYNVALPPSWLTQTNTRAAIPYTRRGRSCDAVIRWSGHPLIRWSGDPSICWSCVFLS